ncbi:MAG TPA: ABC transporter ATP-binding protein [Xanthobacteraceae bacterium]|nr:ABC transporter ATP-binding protein [Xanthobacteraceae bacterium]
MSDAILAADNLAVRLGGRTIVDHVSFALRRGEMTALVGPNGAGKTTLLRALAGVLPARGRITLAEARLSDVPARERARTIAYLPQGHVFHWPMSAAAVVALGRLPHADQFTRLSSADEAAVAEAIAAAGIETLAQRPVTALSGGERARVALARVLATGAAVMLADEPTVSLDPLHQLLVMDLLRQAARAGGAVLAVVHDLALATRFCDRVLVMDKGRLMFDGPPEQALSPERIAAVFGVDAVMVDTGEGRVPIARHPL